ncbi:MAG TPA: glycosyltransferase family 2 protein [Bryobacteraceae bacterium]|nr:glycosyltransferase family 2 protein [Bryobacteraceae bacterium]
MKLSATIITQDEERNIARAMESLRCCDEIVVVDSGSTDRTPELAAKLGARVIDSPWGGYARQKNFAAEHARYDWVLSIDADEALSEALEAEIWQIKKNGPRHDAYTMPRLAQYLGRWILHSGWYPDRKVRLYHRERARWVGQYVHESVQVDGTIGHLESDLLHFTCDSLSEHLKTLDRYTTLAAEQLVSQNAHNGWTKLVCDPMWTFLRTYFLQQGYRDGLEGLTIAQMAAFYNFLKHAKARMMSPRR